MKNTPKIFESEEFGTIRVAGTSEEPIFNVNDLCKALGFLNPRTALMNHVEEDDVLLQDTVDTIGRKQKMSYVTESGMYALVFASGKEDARKFKHYVTSVILPSIRKTGEFSAKKTASATKVASYERAIQMQKNLLNINDASVAMLINNAYDELGINLPKIDYVPSKGAKKSMSALLKENGYTMSAKEVNKKLLEIGILRVMTRPSKKGIKSFYNITEEGSKYGENAECPQNPKETQPQWYVDTFSQLMASIV